MLCRDGQSPACQFRMVDAAFDLLAQEHQAPVQGLALRTHGNSSGCGFDGLSHSSSRGARSVPPETCCISKADATFQEPGGAEPAVGLDAAARPDPVSRVVSTSEGPRTCP